MNNISFLGDVWLPYPIICELSIKGDYIFNLEAPITQVKDHVSGKICLKSSKNHIERSFGRKPLAVCLANNHIMDFGSLGFNDTVMEMQKNEIKFFGAGTLADNCNNPLILDIAGTRVALLGYVSYVANPIYATPGSPGVRPIELSYIENDIKIARDQGVSRIIVSLHWGIEEIHLPRWEDIVIAQNVIDLGADLIIGHHSHCIQPKLVHKNKEIFFGLGNSIFPEIDKSIFKNAFKKRPYWNKESFIVNIDIKSMQSTLTGTYFNKKKLKSKNLSKHFKVLTQENLKGEESYNRRLNNHIKFCSLRNMLHSFISEPRLPKISTIFYAFQQLIPTRQNENGDK